MNERGAKHFAFLSRSGADKPEAARLIASLRKHGASPQVFRADVSDEEAIRRVVVELTGQRPIRGVVHAATVLKVNSISTIGIPHRDMTDTST